MKALPAVILGLALQALAATPAVDADGASSPVARYYGFGPMEILKLEWGLGRPRVADVNGDGLNDLVVVNNRKSRIELLLQKPGWVGGQTIPVEVLDEDVNDLFGREKTWRFKRVGYELTVAAGDVVVADLNSDGLADLAFNASDAVRVALQETPEKRSGSDGPVAPTWAPARKYDIRGSLAVGDLNGDGRRDLAVVSADGAFLLLQGDEGLPGRPEKHYNGDGRVREVWIADLNGDRRDDLAVWVVDESHPLGVRFQGADGRLGPLVRYDLPNPRMMDVVTFPGAAAACVLSVSESSGRLRLSVLGADATTTEPPVLTYPLPATEGADNRDTVVADVDGDGLDDVIVSDPARGEFLLFRADAKTGLTTAEQFPGLTDMRRLTAGDLDGDGAAAVVALSVKEKIIGVSRWGGGRLSYPDPAPTVGEPVAMDLADVDGDGALDAIYVAHEKDGRKYFLRTVLRIGTDKAAAGPEVELAELRDPPRGLAAADVDNDGRVDAMIVRGYGPLLLVRQSEPGVFVPTAGEGARSGLVSSIDPNGMTVAALGPDGSAALLLARKNFARAVAFDAGDGWKVVDQYQASDDRATIATAAAFPLDGDAPAVVTYDAARRRLGFLTRGEDGTYRTDREVEVGSVDARKIVKGAFGGDADAGVLLCGTRKLVLVPNAGRRAVPRKIASVEPTLKDAWFGGVAAVGDLNDDDAPEIALCDQGRKHLEILAFDADASLTAATRFKVFETPRGGDEQSYGGGARRTAGQPEAAVVADVTADGKNDLILLVHDRIIVYPQDR